MIGADTPYWEWYLYLLKAAIIASILAKGKTQSNILPISLLLKREYLPNRYRVKCFVIFVAYRSIKGR